MAGAGDWVAVATGRTRLEYMCKPLVLALLVGVALVLDPGSAVRRDWFVAALLLSLAGDVILMLPRDLFVAGLASFLAAHVAYIGGFVAGGGLSVPVIGVASAVLAVLGAVIGGRILVALPRSGGRELVAPVSVYMAVISAMTAVAAASGRPSAAAGAALFYASDTLIAWNRFVRPLRWAPVAIIVTYHLGQAGLVLSLVR